MQVGWISNFRSARKYKNHTVSVVRSSLSVDNICATQLRAEDCCRGAGARAMETETTTKNSAAMGPVRHHPMHNLLSLLLRILTAGATLAAVIVMVKSTQTVATPLGPYTAKWRHVPAFKWFVVANAIVFVYAVLGALVACLSLCTRRGPLSYRRTAWLTFLVDFALQGALMSAFAAAMAVSWIGKKGLPTTRWSAICSTVDRFCDYVTGALVASLIGWVFLGLSCIVAVSALHHLSSHRI